MFTAILSTGDITGNDGTYSSYLVGIDAVGAVSISITATDNNGSAMIVRSSTTANARAAPVNPSGMIKTQLDKLVQIIC